MNNEKRISEILDNQTFKVDKNNNKKYIFLLLILIIYLFVIFSFLWNINSEIKKIYVDIEKKKIENLFFKGEIQKIKNSKLYFINSIDLKTDNIITKFVNSSISFNNKKYIPNNLISFKQTYIIDTKGYSRLKEEAMNSLMKMNKAFYKTFNKNLTVVSAYRSYSYQKGIKDRGCPDNLCAKAGYSEHQSGLAVDLFEASSERSWKRNSKLIKYSKWLSENAYTFGFHNTYQKGIEVDGYEIEPWHWRYLGEELATYLKENNITIAEFYYTNKKG